MPKRELLNEVGEIRSAGGLFVDGDTVALVHRPKYDDWSIPKGKPKRRESDEECARREVREETGWDCRLGLYLGAFHYRDRNFNRKVARFWLMVRVAHVADDLGEVDTLEWLPAAEAVQRLTRPVEQRFLERVAAALAHDPPAVPVELFSEEYFHLVRQPAAPTVPAPEQ